MKRTDFADTPAIRTRADGSIDTGHYLARGRAHRARAFRDIARRLFGRGRVARAPRAGRPVPGE